MMKKAALICIFLIAVCTFLQAQIQQGYVRTLGRQEKPGVALEGVTVRVEGVHNAVLSGKDGRFQMPMTGKHKGDSYSLQQVQKNGYEPADPNLVGRKYAYSDRVPLTVVMVSKAQLQADKRRIADAAYQTAERNYRQQLDVLERRLSDSSISEGTYRKKLQELQENLERYQELVEGLADHYARADYDLLDAREREVNLCIERGELEKADSLLKAMFNPLGVLERNRDALADADRRLTEGRGMMEKAQEELAAVLRQQEKDAEYLYQLYTIALARFDNDKARQYIETRAALDTTNIEWQNTAAIFVDVYLADYTKSLLYRNRMLHQSQQSFGEESGNTSYCYYSLGSLYAKVKNYDTAMYYYEKSLRIGRESINNQRVVAEALFNTAECYFYLGDYKMAKGFCQEALGLYKQVFGEECIGEADCLNLLGLVFVNQDKYDTALVYYYRALEIVRHIYGEENRRISGLYDNIGNVSYYTGNYKKALEYQLKSLLFKEKTLVHNHPDVAFSHAQLGTTLEAMGNYKKAQEFYQKSIDIYEKTLGSNHASTAEVYHKMGVLQITLGNYRQALELCIKAFPVLEKTYGPNHDKVGRLYNSTALALSKSGQPAKAIRFYIKSLEIIEKNHGQHNLTAATTYANLSSAYENISEYQKAKEYGLRSLQVRKSLLDENHPDIANSYNNIGTVYYETGIYDSAIYFMKKAIAINEKVLGEDHKDVGINLNNIGVMYRTIGQYDSSLSYISRGKAILEKQFGTDSPDVAIVERAMGITYQKMGNKSEALRILNKVLVFQEEKLGEDHIQIAQTGVPIAEIYEDMGVYGQALEYYQRAYSIYSDKLGANNKTTIEVKSTIERIKEKIGN